MLSDKDFINDGKIIIDLEMKFGDGKKLAYCFDRNAEDNFVFKIMIDSNFNTLRYSDFERDMVEKIETYIYSLYIDHFSETCSQFFVLTDCL